MGSRQEDSDDEVADIQPVSVLQQKWWHVPDENIEALVRGGGRPAKPKPPPGFAQGRVRGTRVHFDGAAEEDALDAMLRRTMDGHASSSEDHPQQRPEKWWQVPDSRIAQLVQDLASKGGGAQQEKASTAPAGSLLGLSEPLKLQRRGSGSSLHGDGKITVHVLLVESGDMISLRVSPETRIGPPDAPPANRFTDVFGQGASTKGFCSQSQTFDYKHRSFSEAQKPSWSPSWSVSLKGMIQELIGVEPAMQRLYFRNSPMGCHEMSLRLYNVSDSDTINLSVPRTLVRRVYKPTRDVLLACSKRKQEVRMQRAECAEAEVSASCSVRNSRHMGLCRAGGDVWMMPRWVSQSSPSLFCKVGAALDGDGSHKIKTDFGSSPIYLPDAFDSKLSRVREVVCGHSGYTRPVMHMH